MTENDIKRKRGAGPKPKEQRRKRVKKEVVRERPKFETPPPQADITPIAWRTRDSMPPWRSRNPGGGRDYAGWQLRGGGKPPRQTDRSLGEAAMGSLNIRLSGSIPCQNSGSEQKMVDLKDLEALTEKLEAQGKKLGAMIATISGIERRVDEKLAGMDAKLEDLDSKLQALSALISRMDSVLTHFERRAPREE